MANTGFKGIDIRQTGNELVFTTHLIDNSGNPLNSGTTSFSLFELQSDGTILTFDFFGGTFKAGTVTTYTFPFVSRAGNNGAANIGLWTLVLSSLNGFTIGGIYLAVVINASAATGLQHQMQKFQYGSVEGDLVSVAVSTGVANIQANQPTSPPTIQLQGCTILQAPDVVTQSSIDYPFTILSFDSSGNPVDLDSTPTVTARTAGGTNRASNLSGISRLTTGTYRFTYTTQSGFPGEGVILVASGAISSVAVIQYLSISIVDTATLEVLGTVNANLGLIAASVATLTTGAGVNAVTIHMRDSSSLASLQGVSVSAVINGAPIAFGITNSAGNTTLALNSGTYTINASLNGYNGASNTLVVSAPLTQVYSLTSLNITPSPAGQVTGYLLCYDSTGAVESGITHTLFVKQVPVSGSGSSLDKTQRTTTSNGAGLVQFTGLIVGSICQIRRESGPYFEFTVPTTSTFTITDCLN